ncbi:heavy metal translocating P-type ATPase [Granulicatella elegans]|uniref:heavy metal translocating P-type ATPase n=1 Tax=Granulicatella elegans TaxID=137732 RepID=UPI0028D7A63D|nr:heavy metal translocating P-type ATPase [Granulicatella elegans]
MKVTIKSQSRNRVRLEVPFRCTAAVQLYLEEEKRLFPEITQIICYKDGKHVAFTFETGHESSVYRFLDHLQVTTLNEKQRDFTVDDQVSPVDIVASHIYRKIVANVLIPQPLKIFWLLWKMKKFGKAAFESVLEKKLSMSILDFVAIVTSIAMGDRKTADTIMFLLNLGDDLDEWSQKKSVEDLEKNLKNNIYELWIEKDGERFKKLSHQVEVGDVFVATEGQEIYFDGTVVSGRGFLNESSLTGEAFPVSKKIGDTVFANTVVEQGELLVKVTNAEQNSRLQQIVQLMKTSELHQSKQQKQLLEKADGLVKYNFIGMAVTYLLTRSVQKALTFLLVDYSCALKLSSPVTYLTAIKAASTRGIVVKGSSSLDEYPMIDTYVFDKTGTLTTGVPKIQKILPYRGYSEEEVLRIAACLEEHIYHPIASAVVQKAEDDGVEHEEMHGKLTHVASKGILSSIDGEKVVIGSLELLNEHHVEISEEQARIIEEYTQWYHLLYLGYKGELIAIFLIDTPLRPETIEVLQSLKERGKNIILLTGDTKKRTESICSLIQFDEVYTEVKPEQKHQVIQDLQDKGHRVFMIGDGLNDSAALSKANVGVVMASSSDIARQASDIVFLEETLSGILVLDDISARLQKQLGRNLNTTVWVNTSLMGLGLFNLLTPSTLAVFHNLTTTVIIGKSFTYIK